MRNDLKALEQRWGMALQNAAFGVWDLDVQRHLVHYSPQWKQMLGYDGDDEADPTQRWRERVHPDDLQPMLDALHEHQRGDSPHYEFEFRIRAADGRWRWVVSRGRVVARDAEGQALRMVGTLTDVSDRRDAEALRIERDRMAAANAAKSEFLSRMSHDLRTPLNAVLGFAQLMSQPEQPLSTHDRRRYAGQIEKAGWELLQLINAALDLSDLSDLDAAQTPVDLQVLPLQEMLAAALQALSGIAAQRGVVTPLPHMPAGAAVLADRLRLQQALKQALRHGIWQCAGQQALGLQLLAIAERWHIRIAQGADVSKRLPDSVGLGLARVRTLMQAMGGDVQVSSQGQGSWLELIVPMA